MKTGFSLLEILRRENPVLALFFHLNICLGEKTGKLEIYLKINKRVG